MSADTAHIPFATEHEPYHPVPAGVSQRTTRGYSPIQSRNNKLPAPSAAAGRADAEDVALVQGELCLASKLLFPWRAHAHDGVRAARGFRAAIQTIRLRRPPVAQNRPLRFFQRLQLAYGPVAAAERSSAARPPRALEAPH